MALNNSNFKLGLTVTATFQNSATATYTCLGRTVSDVNTNIDYTVIKCIGTGSSKVITLPAKQSNYVFITNQTNTDISITADNIVFETLVFGESSTFFFDGVVYHKISTTAASFDFLALPAVTALDSTSVFGTQETGGTKSKITWGDLQALITAPTSYTYTITDLASFRAATVEGSGSSATTVTLLTGSYLFKVLLNLTGFTINIANNVNFYGMAQTFGVVDCTFQNAGSFRAYNMTFLCTVAANTLIKSANLLYLDTCILSGGIQVSAGAGTVLAYNCDFGVGTSSAEGSSHIKLQSQLSTPLIAFEHCRFYLGNVLSGTGIGIQTLSGFGGTVDSLSISHCTFASGIQILDALNGIVSCDILHSSCKSVINAITQHSSSGIVKLIVDNCIFKTVSYPIYIAGAYATGEVIFRNNSVDNYIYVYDYLGNENQTAYGMKNCLTADCNYSMTNNKQLPDFDSVPSVGLANLTDLNANIFDATQIVDLPLYTGTGNTKPIYSVFQSTTNMGNVNTHISTPVSEGRMPVVILVPANATSVSFTPFQLETTYNCITGNLDITMFPRTAGPTYAPGTCSIPFCGTYLTGLSFGAVGAGIGTATVGSIQTLYPDENPVNSYVWAGGGYNTLVNGKGITAGTLPYLFKSVTSTVSSGKCTVTFNFNNSSQIPVDTMMVLKFNYIVFPLGAAI